MGMRRGEEGGRDALTAGTACRAPTTATATAGEVLRCAQDDDERRRQRLSQRRPAKAGRYKFNGHVNGAEAWCRNVALYFLRAWMYIAGLQPLRHGLESKAERLAQQRSEPARDVQIIWTGADAGDHSVAQSRGILDTGRQPRQASGRLRFFRRGRGRLLPIGQQSGVVQGRVRRCERRGGRPVARAAFREGLQFR
jgi:hypothetical protein